MATHGGVELGQPSGGGTSARDVVLSTPLPGPDAGGRENSYRTDPAAADARSLPLLAGSVPEAQQERKLSAIRGGGELALQNPPFPESRPYRDAFWAILFVLIAVVVTALAGWQLFNDIADDILSTNPAGLPPPSDLGKQTAVHRDLWRLVHGVVYAGAAGGAASLLAAMGYIWLAIFQPSFVVWTSLLVTPALCIFGGIVLPDQGFWLALMGVVSLVFVFVCYRRHIPFTIKIVETVSRIISSHPGMLMVSVSASVASVSWVAICLIPFAPIFLEQSASSEDESLQVRLPVFLFLFSIAFVVGGQVCFNVCHVTYCGVFGRWYFGKTQEGGAVSKSLRVALTTSFGSICCGAFLIAAVRALEVMVRMARREAQSEGNMVMCIILLILECVVTCIGDFIEYFSQWAYVQVAVRGTSFVQSASITYSMMTCANLGYVLQDLLIDSVVNLGALLCGLVGGGVGYGVGWLSGGDDLAMRSGIAGLSAGLIAGGSAAGILRSGAQTILVLWAEDPLPLQSSHPDVHRDFEEKIYAKMHALGA